MGTPPEQSFVRARDAQEPTRSARMMAIDLKSPRERVFLPRPILPPAPLSTPASTNNLAAEVPASHQVKMQNDLSTIRATNLVARLKTAVLSFFA